MTHTGLVRSTYEALAQLLASWQGPRLSRRGCGASKERRRAGSAHSVRAGARLQLLFLWSSSDSCERRRKFALTERQRSHAGGQTIPSADSSRAGSSGRGAAPALFQTLSSARFSPCARSPEGPSLAPKPGSPGNLKLCSLFGLG
ncbi:hypothetical protein NDU88_005493 [Pleurodeles waltl]|uniref:Uncharacterized protein n=1 Tax=Pleurodeles waltl TaxID=8319 RepID=A0AAV7WYU1_PLEWA|nr:hypothetical protein NDU88_005493 [Pleurodeles waltl]